MQKINNGIKECYVITEDGIIYDTEKHQEVKQDAKHNVYLRTTQNERKKMSLKKAYYLAYHKPFSVDDIEDMDGEQWKELRDSNGYYYISNLGRIKSLYGYKAAIIQPYENQRGYERVDITINGKRECKLVHRLVADAWLPVPEHYDDQIHHIDFNKHNNAAENLRYVAKSEHCRIHNEARNKTKDAE